MWNGNRTSIQSIQQSILSISVLQQAVTFAASTTISFPKIAWHWMLLRHSNFEDTFKTHRRVTNRLVQDFNPDHFKHTVRHLVLTSLLIQICFSLLNSTNDEIALFYLCPVKQTIFFWTWLLSTVNLSSAHSSNPRCSSYC